MAPLHLQFSPSGDAQFPYRADILALFGELQGIFSRSGTLLYQTLQDHSVTMGLKLRQPAQVATHPNPYTVIWLREDNHFYHSPGFIFIPRHIAWSAGNDTIELTIEMWLYSPNSRSEASLIGVRNMLKATASSLMHGQFCYIR